MGVREEEPADPDGEAAPGFDFPFRLGPPNRGRHRDPAPLDHGLTRRGTTAARHGRRPHNDRA
jgi:hypothetical protein